VSTFEAVPGRPVWRLVVLVALGVLPLGCASAGARPGPVQDPARAEAPALPEPAWLPMEARQLLSTRMQRHGDDLTLLLPSVVLLDHRWVEKLTESIASEPRLARAGAGDADTLNARLPARFFELQDLMRTRAKAVAEAARAKDDVRMGTAFGELTQTCVTCHALYVQGEP
jgi:hypothetical protein